MAKSMGRFYALLGWVGGQKERKCQNTSKKSIPSPRIRDVFFATGWEGGIEKTIMLEHEQKNIPPMLLGCFLRPGGRAGRQNDNVRTRMVDAIDLSSFLIFQIFLFQVLCIGHDRVGGWGDRTKTLEHEQKKYPFPTNQGCFSCDREGGRDYQ